MIYPVQDKPNIKWEDVCGLEKPKTQLKEILILPIKYPQVLETRRLNGGTLLYGAPGTGKTYLGKVCARETDAHFYCINASDIMSRCIAEGKG